MPSASLNRVALTVLFDDGSRGPRASENADERMEPIIVNMNVMETGLLDAMVEAALDGLCLLAADGVILKANRLALEMLDVAHSEAIGRSATALLSRNGRECSVLAEVR